MVMEWKKRVYLRNIQSVRLAGSIANRGEAIARERVGSGWTVFALLSFLTGTSGSLLQLLPAVLPLILPT